MCSLIIQMIGMGMGLLIWGSLNMLMGWASGSFLACLAYMLSLLLYQHGIGAE